ADHSGAAADAPLRDRAALRAVERVRDVVRRDVKAVNVVQPAIPSLSDDRQAPPIAGLISRAVLQPPGDDRVPRDTYAMCVCNNNRSFKKAAFLYPCRAGHLAISVKAKVTGVNRGVGRRIAARPDRSARKADR